MPALKSSIAITCLWVTVLPLRAEVPDTVFLEELTWTELRDTLKSGKTTILLPTGGTEENGPHMVLGKHNYIIKYTSERIARRLGKAIVAPVDALRFTAPFAAGALLVGALADWVFVQHERLSVSRAT
jgi:creatinine amidohydrolase